jgi:hypothetical protein
MNKFFIACLVVVLVLMYLQHTRINNIDAIQRVQIRSTISSNLCNGNMACTQTMFDKFYAFKP